MSRGKEQLIVPTKPGVDYALLDSEARTRAILAAAIDAIITIDEKGLIESVNPASERLFGYTPAKNVKMLMPAPYQEEHDGYLSSYMTTGIKKIIGIGREVIGLRKDGSTFPMDLAVSELQLEGKRLFTGIVRDISERKRAENALLDSEARTRAVLAAAVDAIITIDEQGRIESMNPASEKLFGYVESELTGHNVNLLMPTPYHEEHDGYLQNYLRTGIKKIIGIGREVVGKRKDGSTFPMDLAVSEVQLGNRRLFTGIVRDITQRKLDESALLNSEARTRAVLAAAVDAIITIDERGFIDSMNPASERLFGYTAAEMAGKNVNMLMPAPYQEEHDGYLQNYLRTGIKKIIGIGREVVGKRKDGSTFPMDLAVSEVQLEGRRLFTGIVRDITSRKEAEHALLDSEARTRAVLAAAVDAIITIDQRGIIDSMNPASEKLFGYTAAEMIGKNVNMLMPAPFKAEHDGYLNNYLRTGEKKIIGIGREVVGLRKDGSTFPMDLAVSEVQLEGRLLFTGIVRDITGRKDAEHALLDSEARTRAVLAAAVDAIITITERGIIDSMNPASEKLFGYTEVEMIGKNVNMLMPAPFKGEHDGYLQNYLRTGEKKIIGIGREVVGLRKDGSTFPMDLAVSEVQLEGRRLFTGIVRDISGRKEAEHALLDSEARTRAILAAAVDAIITIDERGIVESMNPASERLFGYVAAEMAGKNVNMLMPAPYQEEHDGYLQNYLRTGEKKIIGIGREVVGKRKDGSTFPMDLAVSEVQLEGRRLFTGIVRDITERKRGEEQLRVIAQELSGRNQDLIRSNQELDAFAYIASHDLKEPLRGIHNYATFLVEDYSAVLDDEGKDKLTTLTRLTQRLDGLIDSLLEFSRVGRVDFSVATTDLHDVVAEVIDSMQITLTAKEVDIRIPIRLPRVRGDRVMLGEVYRNLITNAVKYNDSSQKWIELGFQQDSRAPKPDEFPSVRKKTVFYVRDNGLGIPEKHHEVIFRIFKRLHERDAFGGGTGVGLTIVKKVVERHGGEIWLESEPGRGTTFFFTLAEGE
jgi:two-component system sensor kinase FixL